MIGWRARIDRWGLESYHYLGKNLGVIFSGLPFSGVPGAPFQINVHGLALWITSPFYAWAVWPRRTGPLFWALAATTFLVAAPSLLYQNSGWIQFGYRFSNDFAPFVIAMIAVGGRRLSAPFWLLAAAALVVNGFRRRCLSSEARSPGTYFVERVYAEDHSTSRTEVSVSRPYGRFMWRPSAPSALTSPQGCEGVFRCDHCDEGSAPPWSATASPW